MKKIKLLGFIAIAAIIGFSMAACNDDDDTEVSRTFEATASSLGTITINHAGGSIDHTATITTNLPAPNNKFQMEFESNKTITGLTAGQNVSVTVTIPSGYIEGNSVNSAVSFYTLKSIFN